MLRQLKVTIGRKHRTVEPLTPLHHRTGIAFHPLNVRRIEDEGAEYSVAVYHYSTPTAEPLDDLQTFGFCCIRMNEFLWFPVCAVQIRTSWPADSQGFKVQKPSRTDPEIPMTIAG
jgi:hypothetical protein